MTTQFTKDIFFGDLNSPFEPLKSLDPYPYKSVVVVGHNMPEDYWQHLARIPWQVNYYRLALRDEDCVSDEYMTAFVSMVTSIHSANAWPVLCHCLAGFHRSPTAALHVAYLMGMELEVARAKLLKVAPFLANSKDGPGIRYHTSTVKWLKSREDM